MAEGLDLHIVRDALMINDHGVWDWDSEPIKHSHIVIR